MNRPHLDRLLGRLAHASARNRTTTIALTTLIMAGLGAGILQLEFNDNPFDSLPRENPHTHAAERFIERFPGGSYASAVFFEVAPEKWPDGDALLPNRVPYDEQGSAYDEQFSGALNEILKQGSGGQSGFARGAPGPNNITDEVYMRAQEEFWQFLQARAPSVAYDLTISSNIKLVNYTNTGVPNPVPGGDPLQPPDPAAFSYPDRTPVGAQQYQAAWHGRYAASPATIASLISEDWRVVRNVYLMDPDGKTLNEVGAEFAAAVDDYRDAIRLCDAVPSECPLTWNVFDADEVRVDPRSATAASEHLTSTTLEDLRLLGPIVAALLAIAFFIAFRRVGTVLILAAPMLLAGVGVLGIFGFIGLPIHSVSLLVFPILMGNGIDFAFHMASAYHSARGKDHDPMQAAQEAGAAAGTPLFIATLTTVIGMLLLVFAPNVLLAQLGGAIMIGMSLLLLVSLTALPAALTWTSSPVGRGETAVGRALAGNARFWNRNRLLGAVVILVLAAGALFPLVKGQDILIVGTPAAFYPEDDPQRQDFEETNRAYFGGNSNLVTNVLILEGDFTRPQAQGFLEDLETAFRNKDYTNDATVTSINFAMKSWIQVRGGTAGAPAVIAQEAMQPGSTFPQTQEEIRAMMDEMFATPLATYASFFVQAPDYQIGVLVIEMEQPEEFEELEARWEDILFTITATEAGHRDHGFDVHVFGSTSVGYLFAKEEIPYLQVAAIFGLAMTGVLVLIIRRSLIDAATVAAVVGSSGLMWAGTLYLLKIPISITLVGPIVLIAAIGSDYAMHLRYGLAHEGQRAWDTVGRAVFFSAVTDIGAFLVFTQMRYGILRDATVATAAALTCCLIATLILVPTIARKTEVRP